jgi:hypothetical protein
MSAFLPSAGGGPKFANKLVGPGNLILLSVVYQLLSTSSTEQFFVIIDISYLTYLFHEAESFLRS